MDSVIVNVPHAVVFILDPTWDDWAVPMPEQGLLVVSNPTAMSVGTVPEVDGPVELRLRNSKEGFPGLICVFDGVMETPGRTIAVMTSGMEVLLQTTVIASNANIRVFTNDTFAPTIIEVVAG